MPRMATARFYAGLLHYNDSDPRGQTMKNFNLDAILEAMLKMSERVSDLNFSVGRQPQVEVDGQLTPVNFPGLPRLTPFQTEMIAMHMLRSDREATRTLLTN